MNRFQRILVASVGVLIVFAGASETMAQQIVRPALQPHPALQPLGPTYLIGPPVQQQAQELRIQEAILARQLQIKQIILTQQLRFGTQPRFSFARPPQMWRMWGR